MAKRSIKRNNRVIALLAGIVLALGLLPAAAFADGETGGGSNSDMPLATTTPVGSAKAGSQAYQLWVGDVQVTEGNASNILGDGTAVYVGNGSKGTLTLKNASINEKHIWNDEGQDANIHAFGIDLTIKLEGTNTVGESGYSSAYDGIHVDGDGCSLTFEGEGSLTATGYYRGIQVNGFSLTINGGTVTGVAENGRGIEANGIKANRGTLTGRTTGTEYGNVGISGCDEEITLADGMAVLDPDGGKVEKKDDFYAVRDANGNATENAAIGPKSISLWVGDVQVDAFNKSDILGDGTAVYVGDESKGTLTLKNAKVTKEHVSWVMPSTGYGYKANVSASNIDLTIEFDGENAIGDGDADAGIHIDGGSLTFKGEGSMTAKGRVYGICGEYSNLIMISGSVTGVANDGRGVVAQGIQAKGGILTGETSGIQDDGVGINSYEEGITLGEGVVVLEPDGGKIVKEDNGNRVSYKVQNADGSVARKATIAAIHTVTYKVVDGTWSDGSTAVKTESVVYGSTPANVPTGMKAAAGYTGGAWDTNPVGAKITNNTTFTYAFTAIPKKATLTFDLAGGTLDGKTGTVTIEANVGDTVKLPSAPTKDGYTFKYWKGSEYAAGAEYKVEGDHAFTAEWDKNAPVTHTVTFDANGHGKAPDAQEVEDGEKAKKPANPTADGYTFGGWYTDKDCKNAFDFSAPVTSDITLYAKWAKNAPVTHTVTFDANGHGKAPDAQEVEDGKKAKKPSNPTADGYTFGGWYTDKDCKNAFDFSKPVTEDITLYAKWTKKSSSSTKSTSAKTGDPTGGIVVALSATAAVALCLALLAVSRRRRRG